jgi:hypothetical protein
VATQLGEGFEVQDCQCRNVTALDLDTGPFIQVGLAQLEELSAKIGKILDRYASGKLGRTLLGRVSCEEWNMWNLHAFWQEFVCSQPTTHLLVWLIVHEASSYRSETQLVLETHSS